MYGYVYETTCKVNGMKYIGMHKWSGDDVDPNYFGSGLHLLRALNKYGIENFTVRILEWCETRQELSDREKFYISQVKAPINPDYYNINDGGIGGHGEYYKQPVTQKQLDALLKAAHLPMSEKAKKLLSERRTGVEVSEETRAKLRDQQLGRISVIKNNVGTYIWPEQLEEYEKEGWIRGRNYVRTKPPYQATKSKEEMEIIKKKISDKCKNKRWVTNDKESYLIDKELVEEYLQNGFRLGRVLSKTFND